MGQAQQSCLRACPSVSAPAAVTFLTPGGCAVVPRCPAVSTPRAGVSLTVSEHLAKYTRHRCVCSEKGLLSSAC